MFMVIVPRYNTFFDVFEELDGDDRRISKEEFVAGVSKLFASEDATVAGVDLAKSFDNIDTNGGGQILFDEFCHFGCCILQGEGM